MRRRYRPTVRSETTSPSFRSGSFAMRSSPQVGFARARVTISRCRSPGMGGRPGRDRYCALNASQAAGQAG
jgi:hypothetical protein